MDFVWSPLRKAAVVVGLLWALLTAGLVAGYVHSQKAEKAAQARAVAAEQAFQAQTRVAAVGVKVEEKVVAAKATEKKAKEKDDVALDAAKQASPSWADAPVPPDVLSVLRD